MELRIFAGAFGRRNSHLVTADHLRAAIMAFKKMAEQINLNQRVQPDDPYRVLVENRWRDGKSSPLRSQVTATVGRFFTAAA